MAIDNKLFQDLVESMKESVLAIDKSDRYFSACRNFEILRNDIEKRLTEKGAIVTNPESYINKQTGEFLALGNMDLEKDRILKHMFSRFIKLYKEKESFGYKDELNSNVEAILRSSRFKDLEQEVYAKYGRVEGKKFVEDALLSLEDFERENGTNVFSEDIKYIKALNKIKTLYTSTTEVIITTSDNVIEDTLRLRNEDNEIFYFKKSGQVNYNGNIFLVLEPIDKSACKYQNEFYFYIVTSYLKGQKFVMHLDEDINDIVFDIYERLTTQTQIEKNRKKK